MIVGSVFYHWCQKCQCKNGFIAIFLILIIVFIFTSNILVNEELDYRRLSELNMTPQNTTARVIHAKVGSIKVKPQFPTLEPEEIQYRIDQYNKNQEILNEDIYGCLQNDSLVIVIQVHNRLMYLRHTVTSLAKSKGIENALLIFSHDYYDEEMNYYIQSLNFCKIMQIFYPFSIQTHQNQFPGKSPNDCPDVGQSEAIKMKCNNALHPDVYGHYRDAKLTQTKHHWWWKANWVFDHLNVTKNFEGLFLFIEEDHYVLPDFIYMLKLMTHFRQTQCPECSIFSLGSPNNKNRYSKSNFAKVEITKWISNLGLVFNRTVWEKLKGCAEPFCTYDDYNWDWTLQVVSARCFSPRATAMILSAPRIIHFGECGLHHANNCANRDGLRRIKKLMLSSFTNQYPTQLFVQPSSSIDFANGITKNGGWGDIRDHSLCLNMTKRIN